MVTWIIVTISWLSGIDMRKPSIFWRIKWFLVLLTMMIIDIGPVPFSASVLMYIFLFRPLWFKRFIEHLYGVD